jgi:hypothetical protein
MITSYNFLTKSFQPNSTNNAIRIVNLIINIFAVTLIANRYLLMVDIHKTKLGPISANDTLFSTGYIWICLIEMFINVISVPPYVEDHFTMKGSILVDYNFTQWINTDVFVTSANNNTNIQDNFYIKGIPVRLYYNVTSILTFFILFRIYHFFRVVFSFSDWNTPRAKAICGYMNATADTFFSIRAYLKIKPFITICFSVCFVIVVFGLSCYLFEYYNATFIALMSGDASSTNNA